MAVQMQVAFSTTFVGAGIFAGGPYHCSEGSLDHALEHCMNTNKEPNISPLVSITDDRAESGDIDPTSSMAKHQVYMFSGTKDTTVPQGIMNGLRDYYKNYIDDSQVYYENTLKAAHTQPTDDPVNKNACDKSAPPYISDCNYDGSGKALQQIYGALNPRNDGTLTGSLIEFDQTEFIGKKMGMADSGYMYVPANCASSNPCTLHIAFHGCKQDEAAVGDDFIENTGYNKWADTNSMIILYPQTEKSYVDPSNAYGCWDWWGYTNSDNFDLKTGAQMNAIWEMMERISSGYVNIFPPTNVKASNVTEVSVTLAWTASSSQNVVYNVFRNGTQVNTDPVNGLQFEDTTVDSGTYYSYTVGSQDSQGGQSAPSAPVVVKTGGSPPPLQAPTNLKSSDTTAFYVVLSWDTASGATGYNVYRNSTLVGSASTTSFNDTTVSPLSTYVYDVTGTNGSEESSPSSTLEITTPTGWICSAYTSSNYAHVQNGRAYEKLGDAFAQGSGQNMGLDNVAITTTLAETSEDYYVIGTC